MSRKSTGILLAVLGLVFLTAAGFVMVSSIMGLIADNKSLARINGSGSDTIVISEADKYSVWHEYQGWFDGTSINYPKALPTGYSFELADSSTGKKAVFSSSGNGTFTSNETERWLIGSFDVTTPGTYDFKVTGPNDEPRVIALIKGGVFAGLGKAFAGFGLSALSVLLGLALLIVGVVLAATQSRINRPPPPIPT